MTSYNQEPKHYGVDNPDKVHHDRLNREQNAKYSNDRSSGRGTWKPFQSSAKDYNRGNPSSWRDNEGIVLLKRCGVPEMHLQQISSRQLQLLTSKECGVCKVYFTSLSVARAHYLSKGHLKKLNIKQVKSKRTDVPMRTTTPLSPREMYCELCDVRFTSETAANAHYAGKQHHAIVQGSKLPKNEYLTLKRMKERLDQLINREKMHLKPREKTAVDNQKLAQLEFYCNICKTSMTCADQLAAHMNGKKHLSKEKQHIFSKLKNESNNDTRNKCDPLDDDDTDDDDKWVNGDGLWDDDPQ